MSERIDGVLIAIIDAVDGGLPASKLVKRAAKATGQSKEDAARSLRRLLGNGSFALGPLLNIVRNERAKPKDTPTP